MVKLDNISKSFKKINVLKEVNLCFGDYSFNVLVGKSGSGKTTLLNIIGGLDKPTSGNIIYDGIKINNRNNDGYRNTVVGIVFQQLNLIEEINIKQNLKFAFDLAKKEIYEESVSNILAKVNLPDEGETIEELLSKKPNQLSVGQKQRLAIARALIKDPQVLLLDEPTSALDDDNAQTIVQLLKELSKSCTVIVSTHARNIFDNVADQIVELKEKTAFVSKNNAKSEDFSKNEPKFKKGFLSFLQTLKFSIINLKYKKIRLITSFIIALISSVLFGAAYLIYTCDTNSVLLKTQLDNGLKTSSIVKYTYNDDGESSRDYFTDEENERVTEYTNGACVSYGTFSYRFTIYDNNNVQNTLIDSYFSSVYRANINETTASLFGFTPYEGLSSDKISECRLPQNSNEIVISRLLAETLVANTFRLGTLSVTYDTLYNINSIDDLIGMSLLDYTIVGVYSMDDDMFDFWKEYITMTYDEEISQLSSDEYEYLNNMRNGYSISKFIFGYGETILNTSARFIKLSGNYSSDLKFLNSITSGDSYVELINQYFGFIDVVSAFNYYYVSLAIWRVIAVFFVINLLISMNLFYSNVKSMEKDLGILKAMGSSKEETVLIVTSQTIFVTLLEYIFALIGIVIFSFIFNNYVKISLMSLNFTLASILLVILIVFACLVSLTASARAILKRPINVIENK